MDTSAVYVHDLIRFSFSAGKNLTFYIYLCWMALQKKILEELFQTFALLQVC